MTSGIKSTGSKIVFNFSENTDEREKLFTEFVKLKSYASEEISNVLRNITNKESNSELLDFKY